MQHVPVLQSAVLSILAPKPGEIVLDATLGLGGHAKVFMKAITPGGTLFGIDADAGNLSVAKKNLSDYGDHVRFVPGNFRDLTSLISQPVDILLADLGVSSPHLDDPERGFTFRVTSPLDMRYDRNSGQSAAEFLLSAPEQAITDALSQFGELPRSRTLAKALVAHFRTEPRHLSEWTTADVVGCVEKVFTYRAPRVLSQVFQALRIVVNDELGALQSLLTSLPTVLAPGGRCGIISYHSLEDRMVKQTFRSMATPELDQRTGQISRAAPWDLLTRKPVLPSDHELQQNPRSRSARLRAVRRVA